MTSRVMLSPPSSAARLSSILEEDNNGGANMRSSRQFGSSAADQEGVEIALDANGGGAAQVL